MVTHFKRREHQRTNSRGTTFDVRSHDVFLEFSITSIKDGKKIVNGEARLLEDWCRNCYKKVFFISLSGDRKVLFNNNSNPLTRHDSLGSKEPKENSGKLKKQEKLYADQAEVLERRWEEISKKSKKDSNIIHERELKKQENRKKRAQFKKPPTNKKQKKFLVALAINRIDEKLEKLSKEAEKLSERGSNIEKMRLKLKVLRLELEKIKERSKSSSNNAKYGHQIEKKEIQIFKLKKEIEKFEDKFYANR